MSAKTIKTDSNESSLISFFKGCGCFFVLSILILSISTIIGYFYFKPIVSAIKTERELPEFEGPTEQDFWALQEIILNKKLQKSESDYSSDGWDLTPGQFNALLSSIQVPPVKGFCLTRIRHEYKDKTLRYYFIGSGYMQKRLVISFILRKDQKGLSPSELYVNNWKITGDSTEEMFVKNIIISIAVSDKTNLLNNLMAGKIKPYE